MISVFSFIRFFSSHVYVILATLNERPCKCVWPWNHGRRQRGGRGAAAPCAPAAPCTLCHVPLGCSPVVV